MRQLTAELLDNIPLGRGMFVLRLGGCEALEATLPGQFVMLRGDWGTDPLLPRAFSLLAVRGQGVVDILAKDVGKATGLLARTPPGASFSVLGPLGSTFPAPAADRVDWLVAGGVGLAPLVMQAQAAHVAGLAGNVTLFYGGRTAADLVLLDELAALGCELVLATEDGSRGTPGFVTAAVDAALDALPADAHRPTLMACGPEPMLRAVAKLARARHAPGYLSLEGEMACGIGACLACAVPCVSRPFRYTCKDGPVLSLDELAGPYA